MTDMDIVERVVAAGDLSKLTAQERVAYYKATCDSLGLNPLTRPFEYIVLNGKMTLYARKDCTDQLRRLHHMSRCIISREVINGIYVVTARATMPSGEQDESIGAVSIEGLSKDALANALMKAETKAKRRVTLSIIGLGWLDESEIETIPQASVVEQEPVAPVPSLPPVTEEEVEPPSEQAAPAEQSGNVGWDTWGERAQRRFWAHCNQLGLEREHVHAEFGVASMKEWTRSMQDAGNILAILDYAEQLTLTLDDVHQALKVPRLVDWQGTVGKAKEALDAWIIKCAAENWTEEDDTEEGGNSDNGA
jgi:hypothetical protein